MRSGRRCQSLSTLTNSSRKTPSGSCARAAVPDLLQHGAALADDHPLLALALDHDLDADPRPLPLRHLGGDRVRQLVVGDREQLLPHELGDPDGLGHVGDRVRRGSTRPLRQRGRAGARRARRRPRRWWRTRGSRPRPPSSAAAASCTRTLLGRGAVDLVDHDHGPFGRQPLRPPSDRPGRRAGWRRPPGTRRRRRPSASSAVALTRSPSAVTGLWMPGVSTKTSCASGRLSTPRTCVRVVCGLSETMLTFCPTDRVQQRRLADVGAPDERDEAGAHQLSGRQPVGGVVVVVAVAFLGQPARLDRRRGRGGSAGRRPARP